MNSGIFYFSSTGNSLDISNNLAKFIESDIFFIPKTKPEVLDRYEKIIIVTPIYSFGLPITVKEFIDNVKKYTDKQYFCVLHYGGFSGNAEYFTQNFFESKGISVQAIYKMKMPVNFTIVANTPQFLINKTLKKEQARVEKIARNILLGKQKVTHKNMFSFLDKTHWKNSEAWSELAQGFVISDDCTGCGYCVDICTQKNICLQRGKPVFGHDCIACLACYHRCPNSSINYGEKTIGKPRYQNPNVDFDKMK